ncbi:MAG: TIGR00730 family Rossman fold protein [Betaproteobacteria bacterium]|nr:TIGR00730 family Rossman fold protein [Betaproteobacteria bacterium]
MKLATLCVYCGSRSGARPVYLEQARAFGRLLAERDIGIVYGGASIGVMGAVADAALAAGGRVIGVIPEALAEKEVAHGNLTQLLVVDSMHTRKAKMAELSDGFVALPGGIGTFEELFEVWTWLQLGFHAKPVGVLNVAGYWDGLLEFLDHAHAEAFLSGEHRRFLQVGATPETLLAALETWQAPITRRHWVGPGET